MVIDRTLLLAHLKSNIVLEGLTFGSDWGFNVFPDNQIQFYIDRKKIVDDKLKIRVRIVDSFIVDGLSQIQFFFSTITSVEVELFVAYLYGARSDKHFNENYSLTNVSEYIWRILWKSHPKLVCLYPHSSLQSLSFEEIFLPIPFVKGANYIFPDKSAKIRFERFVKEDFKFGQIYNAKKERNQITGEIISYVMEGGLDDFDTDKTTYVIDDICDGGRTFIELANILRDHNKLPSKLELVVPHLINSNNALQKLKTAGYTKVHTSNSYFDWESDGFLHVYKLF